MNIVEEFGLDEENFIWQDLAMCVNLPVNAFFDDAESSEHVESSAKEICSYCPVRSICLQEALEHRDQGIRGGHKVARGKILD